MKPLFTATRRFSPADGKHWEEYLAFSKLTQLRETVSLDSLLNPPLPERILPEDWPHIVNEDFMLRFFTDLPYLRSRTAGACGANLLCVFRDPESHPPPQPGFAFLGYDLIDRHGDISALSNCGGFPEAFSDDELTQEGLLPTFERACAVRHGLLSLYPDEPHARCSAWAIFRAEP